MDIFSATSSTASLLLCLPPIPVGFNPEVDVIVNSYSVIPAPFEQAGAAFYETYEIPALRAAATSTASTLAPSAHGCDVISSTESVDNGSSATDASPGAAGAAGRKKKGFKDTGSLPAHVRKAIDEGEDLYDILETNPSASIDQIKKQYRQLCLIYHPDRTKMNNSGSCAKLMEQVKKEPTKMSPEQLKAHFLKLHAAFEILSEEATRRQYDSSLEFNDSLPTAADITPENFFAVCGAAFLKEAKWSEKKPVPLLGDMSTPLVQVKKFYQFWLRDFTSWRDFSTKGEYELEEAQDREERRWMQKENWKIVSKFIRQERERVFRFVALAESRDPRLLAEKEVERKKREEAKAEKFAKANAAKLQAGEEKRRKEEEDRVAAEAEAKAKADAKRNEKKHIQELRRKIRGIFRSWCDGRSDIVMQFTADDLQDFCVNAGLDYLTCMADTLWTMTGEKDPEIDIELRQDVSYAIRGVMNEWNHSRYKCSSTGPSELATNAAKVSQLNSAAVTAPVGIQAGPASSMNSTAPPFRGHTSESHTSEAAAKKARRQWSLEELSQLSKALVRYPGGIANRWQQIAKFLGPDFSADEVLAQTKIISDSRNLKQSNGIVSAEQKSAFEPSHKRINAPLDTRDTSTRSGWSAEQQTALEKALTKHPAGVDDPAQRWKNIAAEVPGKTARECIARFKEIKEAIIAANKLNRA